jgi:hypothetical protein
LKKRCSRPRSARSARSVDRGDSPCASRAQRRETCLAGRRAPRSRRRLRRSRRLGVGRIAYSRGGARPAWRGGPIRDE